MGLTVTPEMALKAKAAGACSVPKVGTPMTSLTADQVEWAELHGIVTPPEAEKLVAAVAAESGVRVVGMPPTFAIAGSGDGSGDGYGDGYGSGYGYGYGDGYGSGDGSGDGYGDGSGYGSEDDE